MTVEIVPSRMRHTDRMRSLVPMRTTLLVVAVMMAGCGSSSPDGTCSTGFEACMVDAGAEYTTVCADLTADPHHCGACGVECTGPYGCVRGVCGTAPDAGTNGQDGAWSVTLTSGSAGMCLLGPDTQINTGMVNEQTKHTVADGMSNVSIDCSVVSMGGGFTVSATARDASPTTGSNLTIQIPSISPGASQSSFAPGSVTFSSSATVDESYTSNSCAFYFASKSEGVSPGRIWVTFNCPMFTNGPSMSTCDLSHGVAVFDNCASK